jgi:hypothetical protein
MAGMRVVGLSTRLHVQSTGIVKKLNVCDAVEEGMVQDSCKEDSEAGTGIILPISERKGE